MGICISLSGGSPHLTLSNGIPYRDTGALNNATQTRDAHDKVNRTSPLWTQYSIVRRYVLQHDGWHAVQ